MKRTRSQSSPPRPARLSRDADRLALLATRLAASGSRVEDRFWDALLGGQLDRLLDQGTDGPLEGALDHLFASHPGAYDVLIDAAEARAESLRLEGDEVLLVAVPVLAWSKYSIYSGPVRADFTEALGRLLGSCIAAPGVRVALAPLLYSIDQLPQRFSKIRALTRELGVQAAQDSAAGPSKRGLPETAPLLADTRYVLGVLRAPAGEPLFVWQEVTEERARSAQGREEALLRWRAEAGPLVAGVLPGCSIELLLPDAYHVSCRESDRAVRPFGIQAAVGFLEDALQVKPAQLRAVIAQFGDAQSDEYRIAFTRAPGSDVLHGVVWPLYGREEGPGTEGPREQLEALLAACGITNVTHIDQLFPLEFCEDCGAPLYADASGELVHPEMPEDAEQPRAQLH